MNTTACMNGMPDHPLHGTVLVPGDKSVSHRALIIAAMAVGRTEVHGLLESEDVARTAVVLRQLGAVIRRFEDRGEVVYAIDGVGVGGFSEPDDIVNFGNSGTSVRLILGAAATQPLTLMATGDESLRGRPMQRVTEPLGQIGAIFMLHRGGTLPLAMRGTELPLPISYACPVASAQVKSAILLAGLNIPGITEIIEPQPTRDHSERMLNAFGACVETRPCEGGGQVIRLTGYPELSGCSLRVAADPSSAAFLIAAGLMVPDSEIRLSGVMDNPARDGFLRSVIAMGASIEIIPAAMSGSERCVDLVVRGNAGLCGIVVPGERAVAMIDEYPILAVLAASASGETVMRGLAELRVKESDRLMAIIEGLRRCGVDCGLDGDDLTVVGVGAGRRIRGGAMIKSYGDHRIAMAFLILGLIAESSVHVDDIGAIQTSFPSFMALLRDLGAPLQSSLA